LYNVFDDLDLKGLWRVYIRNYYDFNVLRTQKFMFKSGTGLLDFNAPEERLNKDLLPMLESLHRLPDNFERIPASEKPSELNKILLDLINDVMYTEIRSSVDALEAIRGI